jgi:hypothetical protein
LSTRGFLSWPLKILRNAFFIFIGAIFTVVILPTEALLEEIVFDVVDDGDA